MGAGCSVSAKDESVRDIARKYHAVDAENFIEYSFDIDKYLSDRGLKRGGEPFYERERRLSNNYISLPIAVSRGNDDFVKVLIFDNRLTLRYEEEYKRGYFDENGRKILSEAYEKNDMLFINGNAKCLLLANQDCKKINESEEQLATINKIVINDKSSVVEAEPYSAFDYNSGIYRLFYSNVNIKTGVVFRDTIAQASRGCEENKKTNLIICPSVIYKTKKEGKSIVLTPEKIQRDPISLVIDADHSRMIKKRSENNFTDMITVMPLSDDLSVNLVKTRKNLLIDEIERESGLFFEGGSFVYGSTIAGFNSSARISSYGMKLSECGTLISVIKASTNKNKKEDKLSSFNLCKFKKWNGYESK
jgi:hypothetical protein